MFNQGITAGFAEDVEAFDDGDDDVSGRPGGRGALSRSVSRVTVQLFVLQLQLWHERGGRAAVTVSREVAQVSEARLQLVLHVDDSDDWC